MEISDRIPRLVPSLCCKLHTHHKLMSIFSSSTGKNPQFLRNMIIVKKNSRYKMKENNPYVPFLRRVYKMLKLKTKIDRLFRHPFFYLQWRKNHQ